MKKEPEPNKEEEQKKPNRIEQWDEVFEEKDMFSVINYEQWLVTDPPEF